MISFKNNKLTIKNYDMIHFGNDWGLFVDIEKQKINFPNNHEVLRQKYNIQVYNYGESCDDIESSFEFDRDIEDSKDLCIPLIIKASTTTTIVLVLTYIILVVL
jgi:hypothetical protein